MDEAGIGSICLVGHPANGVTAVKKTDLRWHIIKTDNGETGRIIDKDDYRACRVIYDTKEYRRIYG